MNALRTFSRVVRHCQSAARNFSDKPPRRGERSINEIRLLGRAGADAQLRSQDGNDERSICIFRLATNYDFLKKDGERVVVTDWHRVVVTHPYIKDYASKIKTGDRVYVAGRLVQKEIKNEKGNYKIVSIIAEQLINITNKHFQQTDQSQEEYLQSDVEEEENA